MFMLTKTLQESWMEYNFSTHH